MGDTTLPPTPSYNPTIPVVTSAGGTSMAYKDPNSPESILKKMTELRVQTAVDTKYDVAVSPYHEGFMNSSSPFTLQLLLFLTIILFITLVSSEKRPFRATLFLLTLCVVLVGLCLRQYRLVPNSSTL